MMRNIVQYTFKKQKDMRKIKQDGHQHKSKIIALQKQIQNFRNTRALSKVACVTMQHQVRSSSVRNIPTTFRIF